MSNDKKKYNDIEVKDNMKVTEPEEASEKRKELKKVVGTTPVKAKKGLINRLVVGLVGPEGLPGIGSYVNDEIIKPAIKNIIVDAVTSGINMIMYGENRNRAGGYSRPPQAPYRPTVNYSTPPRNHAPHRPEPQNQTQPVRSRYGIEEYVIQDRHDAANVLIQLTEHADMYDTVSIADYYELIGVHSEYTDHNYGWTLDSIHKATVVPVRGGFVIKFPPVEVI